MQHVRLLATGWVLGILTASGVAVAGPGFDVLGVLRAAHDEARFIDGVAQGLRDDDARRRIHGSVLRLQGQLVAVERELRGPVAPPVVDDAEITEMKRALEGATYSEDQLRLLDDLRRDRQFTSDQVRRLIEVFAFSGDRVEAAARLYRHVVDPERFWVVIESMTFSSDKEALRRRITP